MEKIIIEFETENIDELIDYLEECIPPETGDSFKIVNNKYNKKFKSWTGPKEPGIRK